MKSIFKTVSLIAIFSVITRALGFFFRIYLSRSLGAESLGVYQVAFSFFNVLLTVVSSGLPLVISKLTAKYMAQNEKNKEKQMLSCSLVVSIISSVVLVALVLIFNRALNYIFTDQRAIEVLFTLLPAIVFYSIYGVFEGSLWGKNDYLSCGICELFEQLSRIVICVLMLQGFMSAFDGSISVGVSLSVSALLTTILIVAIFFIKKGKLGKPKGAFKEITKPSIVITIVRVVSSLLSPIIAIIIPMRLIAAGYTNSQAMSLFGIATGMTLPLLFIPSILISPLATALVPDLSYAVTKQDNSYITKRIENSIIFSLVITFFLIPLYIGAGEQIGCFFYDNMQSGILLASASWLMIPTSLIGITSTILNAIGLETKSLKNYIVGSILMMFCLWFLPKYVGVKAIFYGMGICTALASYLNIKMMKKYYNANWNFTGLFVKLCLICIPSIAITSFVVNILSQFLPLFFSLAISCSVGAIFFILLCIIFNILNITSTLVLFKEKFIKKHKKEHKLQNTSQQF